MPYAFGRRNLIRSAFLVIVLGAVVMLGQPKLAVILYNHANSLLDQGRFSQAQRCLRYALSLHPDRNGFVYYALAQSLQGQNKRTEAEAYYRKAIARNPVLVQAYVGLAEMLRAAGEHDKAFALIAQAPALVQANAQLQFQREQIETALGYASVEQALDAIGRSDDAAAQVHIARALELVPETAHVQYVAGYLQFLSKSFDRALAFLRSTVELDQGFAPAYRLMADIYFDRGQFELAIDHYLRALQWEPGDAQAMAGAGLSYMNLERYREGAELLRQAVALKPDDPDMLYSLASILRDQGLADEAQQYYQRVLRISPVYVNIHNDLADIFRGRNQADRARGEFERERDARLEDLRRFPANVYLLNSLAYAYAGLGAYADAEAVVRKALALQPDSRQAYMTLALIYEHTDRPAQALAALEKAKGLSRGHRFIEERAAALRVQSQENVFGKVKQPD